MNNFRNAYVDPDSFPGRIYDNYRSSTNPQSIHFSLDNHGGFEQKETQQKQKKNRYDTTKEHSIYVNHQLEKITDSKLVMFSPPQVDSLQKPLNEEPIDELEAFTIAQNKNSENEKKDKEEVVSALVKEFSQMLEDEPSILEEFTPLQADEVENNSLLISAESTSMPENKLLDEYTKSMDIENNTDKHVHTKHGNSGMLFAEFHSMLEERIDKLKPVEEDTKSLYKTRETIDDQLLLMFLEPDELQEESQDIETNVGNIDTLNEVNDPIEEKYLTMLSDSDELQEENQYIYMDIDALNETHDPMEEKYLTILSESDELPEENQDIHMNEEDIDELNQSNDSIEDEFITMLSESDELPEENQDIHLNEEDIDELNESNDSIEDEFIIMLSESDELPEENKDIHMNEEESKETKPDAMEVKDTHFITGVEKKKTTIVKMQVLLARLETDIDIIETIDLLMPLENIVKVEWSIQSLDCKVVIPSKTVFLKGKFVADIEYSNKGLENRIQSMKVSIPWSKTSSINWLAVPDFSYSSQNEFIFQSHTEHNSSYHYESHHKFSEPIHSHLKQIDFIWHQELNSNNIHIQINGFAQLSINFMQEQYVELDCYSK